MATEFRPLNDAEIHALESIIEKGQEKQILKAEDLQISYERLSGGFTVCVLIESRRAGRGKPPVRTIFRGASRQSKHDKPNRIKGDALAFNRAIRDSKPVTI